MYLGFSQRVAIATLQSNKKTIAFSQPLKKAIAGTFSCLEDQSDLSSSLLSEKTIALLRLAHPVR
ncbi:MULTISPECIES: hypothetical protein [Trichocoleus]|uniref:Uncharacterized protein n=1 Tax=Trichocoleus desertorum GB2-A4 TaxID=2933944 RepID=A0ABV0JD72_9CYAN|nr:hypothetical protein [Trichocoleus sp. FACHB-46]MBD1864381.1 hypothetical protein [Trichocoleus sp. FACHB-46]